MDGKKIWHVTTTTTTPTTTTRNMHKAAVSTPREMVKVRVTRPMGAFVSGAFVSGTFGLGSFVSDGFVLASITRVTLVLRGLHWYYTGYTGITRVTLVLHGLCWYHAGYADHAYRIMSA